MKKNARVLVAMSGGVDSSVAACLLREQGYDVVGVFMRLGTENHEVPRAQSTDGKTVSLPVTAAGQGRTKGCCSAADATDARTVAAMYDIPFYALNFEQAFGELVDYFAEEYAAARTPNPCVRCNQWLKFGRLVEYADVVKADYIATGHYAQLDHDAKGPRLRRAACREKDQSYVLFGIERAILDRTCFPLGHLQKEEVRETARRFELPLHDKPESQDICFVPDGDYARVVRARRPEAFRPGPVMHVDGRHLGNHEGVANFTVGQRRGLRIADGVPLYVSRLDADTATVVVGPRDAVRERIAHVSGVSWIHPPTSEALRAEVQIRYHHEAASARLLCGADETVRIEFDTPQTAITPGQAAVFYCSDEVIGGGWIEPSDEDGD